MRRSPADHVDDRVADFRPCEGGQLATVSRKADPYERHTAWTKKVIDRWTLERDQVLPPGDQDISAEDFAAYALEAQPHRSWDDRLITVVMLKDVHAPVRWPISATPQDFGQPLGGDAEPEPVSGLTVDV
jgi:hypothetical protein